LFGSFLVIFIWLEAGIDKCSDFYELSHNSRRFRQCDNYQLSIANYRCDNFQFDDVTVGGNQGEYFQCDNFQCDN